MKKLLSVLMVILAVSVFAADYAQFDHVRLLSGGTNGQYAVNFQSMTNWVIGRGYLTNEPSWEAASNNVAYLSAFNTFSGPSNLFNGFVYVESNATEGTMAVNWQTMTNWVIGQGYLTNEALWIAASNSVVYTNTPRYLASLTNEPLWEAASNGVAYLGAVNTFTGTSNLFNGFVYVASNATAGTMAVNWQTMTNWVETSIGGIERDPIYTNTAVAALSANGFPNSTDTSLSFDDGSRTLTLAPTGASFDYWYGGLKVAGATTMTSSIPDVNGLHVFYIGSDGNLTNSQTYTTKQLIIDDTIVAWVYWDATANSQIFFGEERHGLNMDSATHYHLHDAYGAVFETGLGLGNFTIGNGSLNSHAQFSAEAGEIHDEDLPLYQDAKAVGATWTVYYKTSTYWRVQNNSKVLFPL